MYIQLQWSKYIHKRRYVAKDISLYLDKWKKQIQMGKKKKATKPKLSDREAGFYSWYVITVTVKLQPGWLLKKNRKFCITKATVMFGT